MIVSTYTSYVEGGLDSNLQSSRKIPKHYSTGNLWIGLVHLNENIVRNIYPEFHGSWLHFQLYSPLPMPVQDSLRIEAHGPSQKVNLKQWSAQDKRTHQFYEWGPTQPMIYETTPHISWGVRSSTAMRATIVILDTSPSRTFLISHHLQEMITW